MERRKSTDHQVHHTEKITVWCEFCFGSIIDFYLFEDAQGDTLTINCERRRTMIKKFLCPRLDGSRNYVAETRRRHLKYAREILILLDKKFDGYVNLRGGDIY